MAAKQKFEIEIEYFADDRGYTEDELQELLENHLGDYATKVHSVQEKSNG